MHVKQGGKREVCSRGQRGYTLIEMAISIIVVGVLAAPALNAYANYKISQQRQTTLSNIQYVVDAIQNYRTTNGNYPCPSSLKIPRATAGVANAAYGAPVACLSGQAADIAAPSCSGGICMELSTRVPVLTDPKVIVGAVPFRLLQLDESKTYDGYGSRIVYAVTRSEADINTINDLNGAISIQNAGVQSLTSPADSGIFVVFSPGPTRVGGWTPDGVITSNCTGAIGLDVTNCNKGFEGGVASANPVFIYSYESRAPGVNFYDDEMSYFSSHTDPLWARTPANLDSIHDLTTASVGVGTQNPFVQTVAPLWPTTLDIVSSGTNNALLAYGTTGGDGKIFADTICDENGANCFDPKVIGGTNAAGEGMLCSGGSNKFMVGIAGGGPVCDYVRVGCGNGPNYVLMGFTAAGAPVCGPPPNPSCTASTQTVCTANDVSLAASPDTTVTSMYGPLTASAGGCRHVQYTCNSGTWNKTSDDVNACTFTSSCTTTNGLSCPLGYTGTYSSSSCTNCTGSPTVTTTQATACVCAPGTYTNTQACPAPFTGGTESQTVTVTNPGTCTFAYGSWSTTGCTCGLPATQNVPLACGAGYDTGTAYQPQSLSTSTCTYSNSGPIDYSGCSCSISGSRTIAGSCPAGYTGGQQNQTVVGCNWTNSGSVYGCTCNTTAQVSYALHDCSSSTPVTYPNGYNCYYSDTNPSVGYEDQWTATINTSTCTPNAATVTSWGVCDPKSFTWQQTGVNGNQGTLNGIYETDSCTCQDHMNTLSNSQVCYIHGDTNNTMYLCKCQ